LLISKRRLSSRSPSSGTIRSATAPVTVNGVDSSAFAASTICAVGVR